MYKESVNKIFSCATFSLLVLSSFFLSACKDNNKIKRCQVNGAKAFKYVEKQVSFGHRISGSQEIKRCCDWIVGESKLLGYSPKVDSWSEKTPIGELDFYNIKSVLIGKKPGRIIIGTHYDLKYLPKHPEGFVGANDSASSTAVVMELMRALKPLSEHLCTLEFHFFDGEECFVNYSATDGLFGSRRVAKSISDAGKEGEYNAMVLLDMIGDKDLNITLSVDTDPELTKLLYKVSEQLGVRDQIEMNYLYPILDDHVPFQRIGIPAIDLIDFEYGPKNSHWHSAGDTLENISVKSLKTVGDLAGHLILELSRENDESPDE